MKPHDQVRYSGTALRPQRDYWLGLGDYRRKNAAKADLDAKAARRGTIRELVTGKFCTFARVDWHDGGESETMLGQLEVVQ
jgi:hypothetical protein